MSSVSYSTFRTWVRKMEDDSPTPEIKATKPDAGRPRVQADIRATVIRIRKETGWGYTKILQARRRLGHRISRQAVNNFLVEPGLAPEPDDDPDNRSAFLRRHAEQLPCEILMRDNDQKYPESFDEVFRSTDCQIKRNTPASPNLQAHVERVVQTLKHEVLNAFCIVSDAHLDYILRTSMDWYNKRRGHSARDDLPPVRDESPPVSVDFTHDKIIGDTELAGHLKSYRRAA